MIYLEFNLKDNRQFPFITTKAQKQIGLIEEKSENLNEWMEKSSKEQQNVILWKTN